ELIPEDQGDISLILDYDSIADSLTVEAVAKIEEVTKDPVLVSSFAVTDSSVPIPSWSHSTLADSVSPPPSIEDSIYAYLYLTASNLFRSYSAAVPPSMLVADYNASTCILGLSNSTAFPSAEPSRKGVQVKKKYKPVALCTKPVSADVPDCFRIERNIIGDPLDSMPTLTPNPPFVLTGRFTKERMKAFVKAHDNGFLTKAKLDILLHFMCLHN
ncbi:hypothetical protein H0H93_012301, partial [Arthromyces matolae]